ncbi:MAG: aquaporin, partial [Bacteroidia bacterium]|nr:aquaporin [Bacteroidia bacterium]
MQVTNSKKYLAEGLGTFILVLLGCGAASLHWFTAGGPQGIDIVRIALAFGLTVMVLVYIFGPISGCHINPAVTVSMLIVRRISARDAIVYIICQCLGAIAAAAILYFLTSQALGSAIPEWALGSTGWGEGFHGEFGTLPAFVTELL